MDLTCSVRKFIHSELSWDAKNSLLRKKCRQIRNYIHHCIYREIVINGYFVYNPDYTLKHNNFGDDINFPILHALTGRRVVQEWLLGLSGLHVLYCIGSIVESCDNRSIIWGAGAISGLEKLLQKPYKVLAVRGPLTRKYLIDQGIDCPSVYGDPALLLPYIYSPMQIRKKYKIGIIPHYVDYDLPHVRDFREHHPEYCFIKLQGYNSWQDVIDQICQCEMIVSSSLHGLIVADAYGIPNVHVKFSDNIIGGDFKYRDYMAGVGRKFVPEMDFRNKICLDLIQDKMKGYTQISFNPIPLLKTFPYKLQPKFQRMMANFKL